MSILLSATQVIGEGSQVVEDTDDEGAEVAKPVEEETQSRRRPREEDEQGDEVFICIQERGFLMVEQQLRALSQQLGALGERLEENLR